MLPIHGQGGVSGKTRLKTYGKWLGFKIFSMFSNSPWIREHNQHLVMVSTFTTLNKVHVTLSKVHTTLYDTLRHLRCVKDVTPMCDILVCNTNGYN